MERPKWLSAKDIVYIGLIAALVGVLIWFRITPSTRTVDPKAPATEGTTPSKLKGVPRSKVPVPQGVTQIDTMDKEEIERKMPGTLSEETKLDPKKFVLKSVEILPWRGKTTATSTIKADNNTLVGGIDVKYLPPPMFDWKKEFKGHVRYFFTGDHKAEADLTLCPVSINSKDGAWQIDPSVGVGAYMKNDQESTVGVRAFVGIEIKH